MRSEEEVNRAIGRYADTVRRLCVIHLKNQADTEDIFQDVFLKYVLSSVSFESEEHERAWFIRVITSLCSTCSTACSTPRCATSSVPASASPSSPKPCTPTTRSNRLT